MEYVLGGLWDAFRQSAGFLPDSRRGSNKRYALTDAVAVFFRAPSFLEFQRRMQQETSRSNCHTLFGVQAIPLDSRIRDLLDGPRPDRFTDLFPHCLGAVRKQGALRTFERLGVRLPIALDGIRIHCSGSIGRGQRSTRHVGAQQTAQDFHAVLSATVVADGHNRVLQLMPEFVRPQQDPAAGQPELSGEQRKQDCQLNAAQP